MKTALLFIALSAHAFAAAAQAPAERQYVIPDLAVKTQSGQTVHFYRDLVKDRVVAMNFVFTSCTTVCPTMGATFARVQKLLGDRQKDVALISVSVDPTNDTPERLAAWSQRLGGGPGWTLVTGNQTDISAILKAVGAFTPDAASHTPVVLVGNDAKGGKWERVDGLATPGAIVEAIDRVSNKPAGGYFADLKLTDQDGRRVDLYRDLMKDKVVIINSFFASCEGSCPVMAKTFVHLQEHLGERLGRDIFLISITVDPATDTPAKLKKYATQWKAKPGWTFLTGSQEEVAAALRKIGQYVEDRETHKNVILVGNDRTGLWKKLFGLAKPGEIYESVESVVNDRGGAAE